MEMNCEHGISIHRDCEACTAEYQRAGQTWETKQIRRALAMVDARFLSMQREREAERRLRRRYQEALEAIHANDEPGSPAWETAANALNEEPKR